MVERVFLSHASEDREFTWQLSQALAGLGVGTWVSFRDIRPGSAWDQSVYEALVSCPFFILVLSPESVKSPNVMDEIHFALENNKGVEALQIRQTEIPYSLRRMDVVEGLNKTAVKCAPDIVASLNRLGLHSVVPLNHNLWIDDEPVSGPPELVGMPLVVPEDAARVAYYSLSPSEREQIQPESILEAFYLESEFLDERFNESWEETELVDYIIDAGSTDLSRQQIETVLQAEIEYMDMLGLITAG